MSAAARALRTSLSALAAGLLLVGVAAAQPPRDRELLDQTKRLNEIAAQKVEADVRSALLEAQRLSPSDPAQALERLKQAQVLLENDAALSPFRRESLKRMLRDRIRIAEAEVAAWVNRETEQAEKRVQEANRRAEEERRVADEERLRHGLTGVRDLQREGRTPEASRLADELARRYPNTPSTEAASRTASTAQSVIESRRMMVDRDRRLAGVYADVERSALPPAGNIEYPKDWAEKAERRAQTVKLTEQEKAIMKALDSLVTVSFQKSPLQDAIEYLQTIAKVPILVDRQALEETQIGYDAPVTMNLKSVSLRTALRKMLGELNLAYVIKEETILVTSAVRAREMMTVRTYYLGDLAGGFDMRFPPWVNAAQMAQTVSQIIDLIQSSVEPQSWQIKGGPGTIAFDPRTLGLIIKNSAEVHYMLGGGSR